VLETLTRIQTIRDRVRAWRQNGLRVGFVPTMGNLHRGHLSLVEQARAAADRVVVSVFVNPLQFGPNEDFDRYPRTIEHDTELLAGAKADVLFAPTTFEMYPNGYERSARVDVPDLAGILEGHVRPGHFEGVATVVTKLFQIVQPDVAVFGEKDYQQLVIVRRLVQDLCMPIAVLAGATVRDHDGLAFSSRNRYLSARERNVAPRLRDALHVARKALLEGERNYDALQLAGLRDLQKAGFAPDYFSIRQAADLLPPREDTREVVVLAAGRLGTTRLLDNVRVQIR
jgi:pantoate--beta-alanine ligase